MSKPTVHPGLTQAAALVRAGQWADAVACVRAATAQVPAEPGLLLEAGRLLAALGERGAALEVAERLAASTPDRADWSDAVGTLYSYCDEPLRALPYFERAAALAPQDGRFLYNLAAAQRMAGDLGAAETTLDRVIAQQPRHAFAHYTRADLRTQTAGHNHVDEMARALGQVNQVADRVLLCFALAKELDDLEDYAGAFGYLKQGCDLQRRTFVYDVADDVAVIDRLIERHGAPAGAGGLDSRESIFVFGLPRTGTTLIEQILASHGSVFGAGELTAFAAQTIKAVQRRAGGPVDKRQFVDMAAAVDAAALGRAYLDATRPQTGRTPHFIDKQPTHYLYAGLIGRALPRARLIAVARNPMDACFAMYRTHFAGAYPFSYDLEELASYYAAWHRLMRHWQAMLGERLLVVRYEELVQDPERITRRMLEHCGLAWDAACLAFDRQARPVATASAVQVRRPVYATSVGKWERYREALAPLREALRRWEPPEGWML